MWPLGCVLIEAAVWVSFGRRGRAEFQQRRRHENDEVAPLQRALGRSDCFHNGKTRLKTVEEVFDLVQTDGRRSDELTPKVVRLVLDHLLVDEDSRFEARLLSTELEKIIRTTTDCPDDRSSRRNSASSSITQSRRSQGFHNSQRNGVDDPLRTSPRSQHDTFMPSPAIDLMGQNRMSSTDSDSITRTLNDRYPSVRTHLKATKARDHIGGRQITPRGAVPESSVTFLKSDLRDRRYSQFSPSIRSNKPYSESSRSVKMEALSKGQIEYMTARIRSSDQPWPAQSVATSATARSSSVSTPSQFSDGRKAPVQNHSSEELYARRTEDKIKRLRRLFRGEDQANVFLQRRDHVSQQIAA